MRSAATYTVPSAATIGDEVPVEPVAPGYVAVHIKTPVSAFKHFRFGAAETT